MSGQIPHLTYCREDASLWDDGDLIRLWNAQLNRQKAGDTAGESECEEEGAEESCTVSSPFSDGDHNGGADGVKEKAALLAESGSVELPISLNHLPLEVRALVSSFYHAGYEAGRYAATQALKTSRGEKREMS